MKLDAKKLISLIGKRKPIYNSRHKEHANKLIIDKLWAEIAGEMNCEAWHCKHKWTSLRCAYSRYLRERNSRHFGLRGKRRKKWYLADAMSFLQDYMRQYRRSRTKISEDQCKQEVVEEAVEHDDPVDVESVNTSISQSTPIDSQVTVKRSKSLSSESEAESMIEVTQSRDKEKSAENANTLFFKSLLADYEILSSKSRRLFKLYMIDKMNELQEQDENDMFSLKLDLENNRNDFDI